MQLNVPNNKQLILFDGVCNLCNTSVLVIIKNDVGNKFLFAPLQGKIGLKVVSEFQIDTQKIDSFLLYLPKQNKLYYKSEAALRVAAQLRFPFYMIQALFIIPKFIRNWGYDIIAKYRYKWFGKKEACMVPTPELSAKFLA